MRTPGHQTRWSATRLTVVVAVAALAATALVFLLPVRPAYPAPALHAVVETVNALIALLVAYLVLGRYLLSRRLQELLLLVGLVLVATANLLLTALPAALPGGAERAAPWDSLMVRLLGAVLIACAALAPSGLVPERGRRGRWAVVVVGAGLLATLVVLRALYLDRLPVLVDVDGPLEAADRPLSTGHRLVLGAQVAGLLLYVVAAVAFTRQAARAGDELLRWLAVHCVLAGVARVHYLLSPPLYSDHVSTGDALRLVSYVLLLVGAAREIQSYWQARTAAAVLEDRRRLARDLHDGLTQELSYVYAQAHRLRSHPDDPAVAEHIIGAAGRALDEARLAIGALTRPAGQAVGATLQQVVEDLGRRHDIRTATRIEQTVMVTPTQAEVVLRVTSEAVRNAVRHGAAASVTVTLDDRPLRLAVRDDGRGFDPARVRPGGFGLTSMCERAEAAGAEYLLSSRPGEGTQVQVRWP